MVTRIPALIFDGIVEIGCLYFLYLKPIGDLKDFRSATAKIKKGRSCSGLIKPDTNIGGNITATGEVFNEKTASIFLDRI